MPARPAACAAVAAASLALASSANAAVPRYECPPNTVNCTAVTGAWLDIPAATIAGGSGIARDQFVCPSGIPVGYTYPGGDDGFTWVYVQVFQTYPNTEDPWNPAAGKGRVFVLIQNNGPATTVQLRIGCAPEPNVTGVKLAPSSVGQQERTTTVKLARSQGRTYTRGCPAGTHLVHGDASVEFDSSAKPTASELAAVKLRATESGNRETWRVTTTAALGSAHAVLKTFVFCDAG